MIEPCKFIQVSQRLNLVRMARVKAILPTLHRDLFSLIAFLFHVHHQDFPGYNGPNTAHGVRKFEMSDDIQLACERFELPLHILNEPETLSFDGIYVMGSAGSFGQSNNSDIDVWIVHDTSLCCGDVDLLQNKADRLTQWFAGFNLEVNFYLIHPLQFIDGHPHRCEGKMSMAHEHSGSAQHWLLLEEFYRTHIRLAGKILAWWPDVKKKCPFLSLGEVSSLPASEYFGATLWQLYKGLETPHKALLKVLLLEAYAHNYPNTQLICEQVWDKTVAGDFSAANDPYFLLYHTIEKYLLGQKDLRRLEIVRRCFYLKCGIKLTHSLQAHDWRYSKMKSLVESWEWPESLLTTLDDCENWHSGNLQWFNGQLNELMLTSYQTLLHFAAKQGLREGLRVDEMGLLTRKLHTYFSEDKHQIQQLNRLWSQSVFEPHLTIVYSETKQKYYLYRQPPKRKHFMGESAIYEALTPVALMMWACLNGIARPETQWHEYNQNRIKSKRLGEAANCLLEYIGGAKTKVSKRALCQPWFFRKLIILVNLDYDPSIDWQGQEIMVDYMNANVFALGKQQKNILGSVDIIGLNSWGEWHSHHFLGANALLDAAVYVTPGLRRSPKPNVPIEVVSGSVKLKHQLEVAVSGVFKQIASLCQKTDPASTLVQPIQIGCRRYGLFLNNLGMGYEDLSEAREDVYEDCPQVLPRPELENDPLVKVPDIIQDFAADGAVQYFLRQRDSEMDVFILNEQNTLSHYIEHEASVEGLVTQVSHHYAFDAPEKMKGKFNLPQFFKLLRVDGQLRVLPFGITLDELETDF